MIVLTVMSVIVLSFVALYMRDLVDRHSIQNLIKERCYAQGLSKENTAALLAIAHQESNFNPFAVVKTDREESVGLFQFNINSPPIAVDPGFLRVSIVYQIDRAIEYYIQLRQKGYSIQDIFHIWNIGETKFRQGIRSPAYQKYAQKFETWRQYA